MRFHLMILGFLAAMACPSIGYAQYDIVAGSIREQQTALTNGDSARRQTFQISPRRVVGYKHYVVTLIHDDQTGVIWFAFEGTNNIQTTQPTRNWIVAKSKDGRSLASFQAVSSKLTYRVSRRSAGSMDSARSLAMSELSAEIAAFEADLPTSPEIDLSPHFDVLTFSGATGMGPGAIKRVTGTDDGWLVELASHPTKPRTAFVYLSEDFKVLKVDVRNN